jgi:hypothetical protein
MRTSGAKPIPASGSLATARDVQQRPRQVQILHPGGSALTGASRQARNTAVDPRLPLHIAKEQKDALDNLHNFAGFVGLGNSHRLHCRRTDSPPVAGGRGGNGIPSGSGTQGCLVASNLRRVKQMPLINIVIALIVVGVALWLINNFIPMAGSIKSILNIVVVIAVAVWVLKAVGMWGRVTSYRFMH